MNESTVVSVFYKPDFAHKRSNIQTKNRQVLHSSITQSIFRGIIFQGYHPIEGRAEIPGLFWSTSDNQQTGRPCFLKYYLRPNESVYLEVQNPDAVKMAESGLSWGKDYRGFLRFGGTTFVENMYQGIGLGVALFNIKDELTQRVIVDGKLHNIYNVIYSDTLDISHTNVDGATRERNGITYTRWIAKKLGYSHNPKQLERYKEKFNGSDSRRLVKVWQDKDQGILFAQNENT